MFTGLIEDVGRIANITTTGGTRRLIIAAERAPRELKKGDSVSVSGVCLTAVEIHAQLLPRRPGGGDLASDLLLAHPPRARWSTWNCR